jgi:hypothetical protein
MSFKGAKRQGLMDNNPFEFVRHRPGDASERRAYVPVADIERVIEHAPNTAWKLLIALSRFAGLRVPSEALSLRWQDVDWERGRLTVPRPKTEHLAGRSHRVIPLFPKLRPFLEAAWDDAPDGAEYVIPEEYRRRAQAPHSWANANLGTTLKKVVIRAGLETWPRLWHSMRAGCETDLAREYPPVVVAKWLGNTQAVAMRHYVDVTDADFERAATGGGVSDTKAAQKAAQSVRVRSGDKSQAAGSAQENPPVLQDSATSRESEQNRGMEAAGIELVSSESQSQKLQQRTWSPDPVAAYLQLLNDTQGHPPAQTELDPAYVLTRWPHLPAHIRQTLMTLVRLEQTQPAGTVRTDAKVQTRAGFE